MKIRRYVSAVAVTIALVLPVRASAAQDLPRTPVVFLEKVYFSLGTPTKKNLRFEGLPTVHYFFYNGLSDQVWQAEGGWAWAFPVSVLFQVRMIDTTSEPVRTPSYRIRPFHAQLIHLRRDTSDRLAFRLLGVSVGAAHYSNGQSGCFFSGFERDPMGTCIVSDAALAAQRRTNVIDGDFSTSYLSLALNWRAGRLIDSDDPVKWQYTLSAEGQAHPLNMKPGGMNAEQAKEWGQHQWNAAGEFEWRAVPAKGVVRFGALHERRFGGGVKSQLARTQIEVSYVSDRAESLGAFLRWHSGFDYYNIQFQDNRRFMAVGVIWDPGRLDKLNTAPPP